MRTIEEVALDIAELVAEGSTPSDILVSYGIDREEFGVLCEVLAETRPKDSDTKVVIAFGIIVGLWIAERKRAET